VYDTCPPHHIFLHLITLTILREELQLRSSSLFNVLRLAVTSPLFDQLTCVGSISAHERVAQLLQLELTVEASPVLRHRLLLLAS
jgi:hypothetical protein